jgi:endonuclease YncB( thermonuclease family)
MREHVLPPSVRRIAARQLGALAIAGLLAAPLYLATEAAGPAVAGISSSAPHVTGTARAIDGDTITVGIVRVRLEGIDAPELDQTCGRGTLGKWLLGGWSCGKAAASALSRLVDGQTVRCDSRGKDAYGRVLGVCSVHDLDINAHLVREGLAWAFVKYSQRYVAAENEARAAKRGVWQGEAKPAWVWRAERWQGAQAERRADGPTQCVIKGNITRSGHIYHMPWDRWYDKTRVETAKGERWFCSEAEALAAGWRPAVVR